MLLLISNPGIFGTNRPSLIEQCVSLPDMSDHDVVRVDSCVLPARKKPVRKVDLWKRKNKQAMEKDLAKFTEKVTKDFSTSTPMSFGMASDRNALILLFLPN